LSPTGRRVFLAAIFLNTGLLALAWTAVGAWPVLPYAGIELAAVAFAFHLVGRHDADYERLTIVGATVLLETCECGTIRRLEFNKAWAQVVCRVEGNQCSLSLRSHGREIPFGRLMTDEARLGFAQELKQQLRLVAS